MSSNHTSQNITFIIRIPSDFSGGPSEVTGTLDALHTTLGHSVFSFDFHVNIDEFQNFATDTFENIFSEVRKYKLDITVAYQYMDQLSPSLRRTILGNVANLISFRAGAEDSAVLA